MEAFEGARQAVTEARSTDPFGIAAFRFWGVLRGDTVVAVFVTDGMFYSALGSFDVYRLYRQASGSINLVMADVLRLTGVR